MATNKPQIKAYTDEITITKLKYIAENQSRSLSKEIDFIVKEYIKSYEKENGEVKVYAE